MKKLMFGICAIMISLSMYAWNNCEIPDGWIYYTRVSVNTSVPVTVIVNNSCGSPEYKICWKDQWLTVRHGEGDEYYFYDGSYKNTFRM